MAHILVVDDDGDLRALLKTALERDGHQVSLLDRGGAVSEAHCRWADCILLDVMMPGEDGFATCRRIRALAACPILFLTAKTEEADVLTGLGLGGDDYLSKPFRIAELRARVAAHLRRESRAPRSRIRRGGLDFDLEERAVYCGEEPLHLTRGEYAICAHLWPPTPPRPSPRNRSTRRYSALTARRTPPPSRSTSRTSAPSCGPWGSPPSRPCGGWATNGKAHEAADGAHRPVLALPARHRRGGGAAGRPLVGRPVRPAPQRLCPPGGHRRRAGGRAGPRPGGRGADPGGAAPLLPLGHLRRLRPGGGAARHGRAAPGLCPGRAGGRPHPPRLPLPAVPPLRPAPRRHGVPAPVRLLHALRLPALQEASRSFRPAPRRCCWRPGWPPGPSPPGTSPACSGGTPPSSPPPPGPSPPGGWTSPGRGARVRELGRAWPPWSSSGRPWPGLCPSSGPWSRSAPRRWPPWPTTSRPPCPSSAAARSCWRRTPSPPPSGSAWTPFSAAPDVSGTIWSSCAPSPPPGARRRRADGRRRSCPRWRRAGRPLGAACAPPGGLRFSLDCPASRPCTLFRSELDRAVLNLLDNAARFTPEGGAVRLSAYVEEAVLTVAVEDSGPGFSPEALARAGRGFYTGDASRPPGRSHGHGPHLRPAGGPPPRRDADAVQHEPGGARAALTLPL